MTSDFYKATLSRFFVSALILHDYVDVLNKITEANCFFLQYEDNHIPSGLEHLLQPSSLMFSDSVGGEKLNTASMLFLIHEDQSDPVERENMVK